MVTAYVRAQGVICYKQAVFATSTVRREIAQELLATNLEWYWESGRRNTARETYDNPALPDVRSITQLTDHSVPLFLDDLTERNADDYGRWINLFGADTGSRDTMLDSDRRNLAIQQFAVHEEPPIGIIIIQVSDVNAEYLFVPHQPLPTVETLLAAWGVSPDRITTSYPYAALRLATLESWFGPNSQRF
jgi:hypothetical protein